MVQLAAHVLQLSFQLQLRLSEPAHLAHVSGGFSYAWHWQTSLGELRARLTVGLLVCPRLRACVGGGGLSCVIGTFHVPCGITKIGLPNSSAHEISFKQK